MELHEARLLATQCLDEITNLRRTIDVLRPKAEAYDLITKIVDLIPDRRISAGRTDIVWMLRKKIDELNAVNIEVDAP